MAVVLSEDVQPAAAPIAVPTVLETLAVAGFSIPLPSGNAKAVIRGWADVTIGNGTTGVTLSIYSGTDITGRLVGTRSIDAGNLTPGSTGQFTVEVIDRLTNVGGAQYCMSVSQTAATGDGTIVAGLIDTTLLSG